MELFSSFQFLADEMIMYRNRVGFFFHIDLVSCTLSLWQAWSVSELTEGLV